MNYIPYNIQEVLDTPKKFTVISTFAGGGGSSTGYRLAGGNVLCINEFIPEAIQTYSQNFPDTKIIPGDIKNLSGRLGLGSTFPVSPNRILKFEKPQEVKL